MYLDTKVYGELWKPLIIAASLIFSSILNLFSSFIDMILPTFLDTLILQQLSTSST